MRTGAPPPPNLRPGALVEILDVDAPVAGRYVLTEAVHTLTEEGFFSEISSRAPEPTSRPRGDVATVGVVTHVADPQQLGRVRVSLPAYQNVSTGWIPVVLPAAGRNKGFVCMPDAGDRVLVLLARENPAHGIVLGGLYGEQQTPDGGLRPDDPQHTQRGKRYTWTTAAGQRIQLNENGDLLRLENRAGAVIELNGSNVLIKGKRIDFNNL